MTALASTAGLGRHAAGLVHRIEAATPTHRDRGIDAVRALALCGVVVGHWLVGALVLNDAGELGISSPLRSLSHLAPASWLLQMLGLFFLVGGYSSTLSWTRASERGARYHSWLADRLVRLTRPVLAVTALSTVAFGVLSLAGVPARSLRTWVILLVQPLWFIGVYLAITALTAAAVTLSRSLGVAAALLPLTIVVAVDVARYGPWQAGVPDWLGLLNVVPAWLFAYQLGISWALGQLGRRQTRLILLGGVGLFVALLTWFGYPASMVGVPGGGRSNAHPPSLLVIALAAAQSGVVLLLRDRITALAHRPRVWAGAALVNLGAMSILCWHHVALAVVSLTAAAAGGVPGLTDEPGGVGWLVTRLAWFPVLAATLVAMVAFALRFDRPWTMPAPGRVLGGFLTAGFAVFAVLVY